MAEEAHSQVIDEVVQRALDEAKLAETALSAVAVTIGPGLSLCLRVGVQKARKIAGRCCLPIVGIHHMEAHALVARLVDKNLQFPFLALLVSGSGVYYLYNSSPILAGRAELMRLIILEARASGCKLYLCGHNLLILARDLGHYVQLGTTIDDAIGEAYDKIARWLGLDMRRGGPALEELAREGNAESIKFRVPMKQHKDCNFSYAGLKTQVRLAIESKNIDPDVPISCASCEDRTMRADIAASFQRVAVMHLEERCERAIKWALQIEPSIKSLVVSGGVASNQYLRTRLNQIVEQNGLRLVCPPPRLCTDNGVMIAWTGIEHFTRGRYDPPPPADEPDDALLSRNQMIYILLEAAFIIHHGGLYNIPKKHSAEQTKTYAVNIIRNSSSSLKLGLPCLPNPHPFDVIANQSFLFFTVQNNALWCMLQDSPESQLYALVTMPQYSFCCPSHHSYTGITPSNIQHPPQFGPFSHPTLQPLEATLINKPKKKKSEAIATAQPPFMSNMYLNLNWTGCNSSQSVLVNHFL
ncbi:hypothetical protein Sjap_020520 [Stephania japonica]|uniref:N(6)-L-threonylcarbamoyladenine synthase n=1 Tax=Stephania japonica TaxID=461633 RepID=A0AAP0F0V0_9MAGN